MSIDPNKIKTLVDDIRSEIGTGDDELVLKRREQRLAALVTNQKRTSTNNKIYWLIAAAALCIAAPVGFTLLSLKSPSEPLFEYTVHNADTTGESHQWILSPKQGAAEIRFLQGSRFSINDKGAMRILSHSRKLVHIELHTGQLQAQVNGNGVTTWKVSAGPFQLSVLGTQFDVDWNLSESTLHVHIKKGVVLVQGGGLDNHGIRLYAGHKLLASGRDGTFHVATEKNSNAEPAHKAKANRTQSSPKATTDSAAQALATDTTASSVERSHPKKEEKATTWLMHYNNDDFQSAADAIHNAGLSKLLKSASAKDLWKISQVFRNVRDSGITHQVLLQLRKRYPSSSKAKVAAFMLGRNLMEQQNNPKQATVWFERYIKESPNGSMIQEAYNRLLSSYSSSNQPNRAKEVAGQYLKKFPDGVYASKATQIYHR